MFRFEGADQSNSKIIIPITKTDQISPLAPDEQACLSNALVGKNDVVGRFWRRRPLALRQPRFEFRNLRFQHRPFLTKLSVRFFAIFSERSAHEGRWFDVNEPARKHRSSRRGICRSPSRIRRPQISVFGTSNLRCVSPILQSTEILNEYDDLKAARIK